MLAAHITTSVVGMQVEVRLSMGSLVTITVVVVTTDTARILSLVVLTIMVVEDDIRDTVQPILGFLILEKSNGYE